MTFPLSFAERLYGFVLLAYPRPFRARYENEMRLVFRDLLADQNISRRHIARLMAVDLIAGLTLPERLPRADLVKTSVLYGLLIVAISIASQAWHPGLYIGVPVVAVPFLLFLPAAFWGARSTRSFAGGIWVAVIMGGVSSTMVAWDWLLFGLFPFYDVLSLTLAMVMTAGFCIGPAIIGAIAGVATAPLEKSAS